MEEERKDEQERKTEPSELQKKKKWYNFSKKTWILILIIGFPIVYFGGGAFLHATSRPNFCISCHEMTSACGTWNKSKHSLKGVECLDCHVKPGKINYLIAKVVAVKHGMYHLLVRDPEKMKKLIRESAKAPWEACYNCHKDIRNKTIINGLKIRHHNDEFTEKYCTECHWKIAHAEAGESSHPERKGCFECHNDVKAPRSKCDVCHPFQGENYYSSFKAKLGILCVDCHIPVVDFKASSKSCMRCHRGKDRFEQVLKKWQDEICAFDRRATELMNKLETLIIRGKQEDKRRYTELKDLYTKLKYDGSKGVHNFEKISTQYANVINVAEGIIKSIDKNYKPSPVVLEEVSCVRNCHKDVDKLKVPHHTVNYNHYVHINKVKMTCRDCHSGFEDHGKTLIEDCVSCHHWDVKEEKCQKCHIEVKNLYEGTLLDAKKPQPSFKAQAGIKCVDCHKISQGRPQKGILVKSQCLNCHDENVANELEKWLNREAEIVKEINTMMQTADPAKKQILKHMKEGKPLHNFELVETYLKKTAKK